MDEIDRIQPHLDAVVQEGIRAAHAATPVAATGYCLWCAAPLASPQRWCDIDCRDDWDKDHAAHRH